MTLGEKLKDLRTKKGLSLDELANEFNRLYNLNVARGTISRWENDVREPVNSYLSAYAKYFNVSLDWLLDIPNEGYYLNTDAAEYAEYVRTNPNLRIMFSAAKDVSKENLEKAVEYIEFLKSKERSNNDE